MMYSSELGSTLKARRFSIGQERKGMLALSSKEIDGRGDHVLDLGAWQRSERASPELPTEPHDASPSICEIST